MAGRLPKAVLAAATIQKPALGSLLADCFGLRLRNDKERQAPPPARMKAAKAAFSNTGRREASR